MAKSSRFFSKTRQSAKVGLRITVTDVLEYLAAGMTEEQIISDFPELTKEDIHACLAFAAEREKKLSVAVA